MGVAEAHHRFQCVIHAYCLMGNHYHLLIETPTANLSRVMRHINGVYTQRYNLLKKTDGPLFRGRFKSILVDADAYLLRLSRYIHRNPIDMKRPLVQQLEDYPWSSYSAYIVSSKAQEWLEKNTIYQMLGSKQRYAGYANFVGQGTDEHTAKFYSKGNLATLIGDGEFREYVYTELMPALKAEEKVKVIRPDMAINDIVGGVAKAYKVAVIDLQVVVKGPQKGSEARKVAMYLCQEIGALKLAEIARYFNLGNIGSVSFITHQIRKRRREDSVFAAKLERLIKSIVKKAT